MAKIESSRQYNVLNRRVFFNAAGVITILLTAAFLIPVIRDTEALTRDPLAESLPQLTPEQARERIQQSHDMIELQIPGVFDLEAAPFQEVDESSADDSVSVVCYSRAPHTTRPDDGASESAFLNMQNLDGGLKVWLVAGISTEPTVQ